MIPRVVVFRVSRQVLTVVVQQCPALRTLGIQGCKRITAADVELLLTISPGLAVQRL